VITNLVISLTVSALRIVGHAPVDCDQAKPAQMQRV